MAIHKSIGTLLRELRANRGLLLREVGAKVSLDPTLLSKIERDERMPTRVQINALADLYKEQKREILTAWLSDKLTDLLQGEELAIEAMKVAEEKLSYRTKIQTKKINL